MNYSLQRNICRTCLTEGSSAKSIFSFEQIMGREIQLCDMLMAFSSLVVVHGDGLPENICLNCFQHMTAAYSFKKLCEASDTTLRENFRVSNGIIILNSIKKEEIEFDDGVESNSLGQGERNDSKDDRSGTQNVETEINKSEDKTPNFLHNERINDGTEEATTNNFSLAAFHSGVGEPFNNILSQLEKSRHKETIDENGELMDQKPIFLRNDLDLDIFIDKSEDKTPNFLHNNSGIYGTIVEPKNNSSLVSFHEPMEESCNTLGQVEESRHKETIDENEEATDAMNNIKSKKAYEKSFKQFMDWRDTRNVVSFSESVLLLYFEELASKMKSSTVWTHYSIIKSLLNMKHNIDISKYKKLNALLKRNSEGYTGKKSKTFSPEEIKKFMDEAPDYEFLLTKVAMIFGIMGACRRHELYGLQFQNVRDIEDTLIVNIVDTNNKTRMFTVTGRYYTICKKYMQLRPEVCHTPSFFVNYYKGKCTVQNVGINRFGNLGKQIATYLKLPNPNLYTGHCFRRTSATVLVDSGGDITTLKRRSALKFTNEGHVENTG